MTLLHIHCSSHSLDLRRADELIDSSKEDVVARVKEVTGGKGAQSSRPYKSCVVTLNMPCSCASVPVRLRLVTALPSMQRSQSHTLQRALIARQ